MKKSLGVLGALALGLGMVLTPTAAGAGTAGTIYVPDDFVAALSDTRATGDYELTSTGLRIWTQGSTSTDKVAEYVATDTPLAEVGDPALDVTTTSGTIQPGFQLVVDFNADGTTDGILVGELVYGGDWWLNNAAAQFAKDAAPRTGEGRGSNWFGSLTEWRSAFPSARVRAFGFSLGSGVLGDHVIRSITFAGTRYTFAEHVVLASKAECKNGGWATSTRPVFANQGQCVASFASAGRVGGHTR